MGIGIASTGFGSGCDHVIQALHGFGHQYAVSGLCHSCGLVCDESASKGDVASPLGKITASSGKGHSRGMDGHRDGGSGVVCTLALSADGRARMASVFASHRTDL